MTTDIPSADGKLVVLVVGLTAQSGKSTVARAAAARLAAEWIPSSAMITARLEKRLGLAPGTVSADRDADHEAWRSELFAEGDIMRAEGTSPGEAALAAGYRVIDGLRTGDEVGRVRSAAKLMGLLTLVICVDRPNTPIVDRTDVAGLTAEADVSLHNDGNVSDLERKVGLVIDKALEEQNKS